MPDGPEALKPAAGGGRSFLGVRRISPHADGVHLFDDEDMEVGIVRYGERVYVNGSVMSFKERHGESD